MNSIDISSHIKRMSLLLFIGMCITSLSACGGSDKGGAIKTSATKDQIESVTAIREVLLGNSPFLLDGEETYINQITALDGEDFYDPLAIVNVASVDFDQDGDMEAVVELTNQMDGWRVVLHYSDGSVFGYEFGVRSMQDIYEDGTIIGSSGAEEENVFRLSFKNGEVKTKKTKSKSEGNSIQWYGYSEETIAAIWSETSVGDVMKSEIAEKLLNYEQASEMLENGDYESALSLFESLGEFEDASRHADGIRCMEYAEKLGNKLSTAGNLSTEWLAGATIRCNYSPESYTFTERLSFSKSGLYGWAFSLGSAMGELNYNNIDPDGIKSTAEDLYYDYFYQSGYPGIICVVEWYDEANDAFLSGSYSGLDDVPSSNGSGKATLQDVQEYATNKYFVIENGVLEEYCGKKTVVEIPEGVVAIGQDVFAWNDTVEEVYMPTTLKTIDDGAFFYCENLQAVHLNDGLEKIGFRAFYYNSKLKSITIPESVVEIAEDGILGPHLTDVYYEGTAAEWEDAVTSISVDSYEDLTIHTSDLVFKQQDAYYDDYDEQMEEDFYNEDESMLPVG